MSFTVTTRHMNIAAAAVLGTVAYGTAFTQLGSRARNALEQNRVGDRNQVVVETENEIGEKPRSDMKGPISWGMILGGTAVAALGLMAISHNKATISQYAGQIIPASIALGGGLGAAAGGVFVASDLRDVVYRDRPTD